VPEDVGPAEAELARCQLQFTSCDTVGAGRQHRVAVLLPKPEEPAERPRVAQHLGTAGLGKDAGQPRCESAPRGDVDAGGGVRPLFGHVGRVQVRGDR
jgi:hypothetical protein